MAEGVLVVMAEAVLLLSLLIGAQEEQEVSANRVAAPMRTSDHEIAGEKRRADKTSPPPPPPPPLHSSIMLSRTSSFLRIFRRYNSTNTKSLPPSITSLLATPTWSVRSQLPDPKTPDPIAERELTSEKLHHLLRLCALPPPETLEEETKLLKTLREHLHFVRAVQSVDTMGVEPLHRIEDEVAEAQKVITWEDIMGAEEKLDKDGVGDMGSIKWDPMSLVGEERKRAGVGMYVLDAAAVEEDAVEDEEKKK